MAGKDEGAVVPDGTIEWRDDDGPAASYPDGRRVWFVEGEKVGEERRA